MKRAGYRPRCAAGPVPASTLCGVRVTNLVRAVAAALVLVAALAGCGGTTDGTAVGGAAGATTAASTTSAPATTTAASATKPPVTTTAAGPGGNDVLGPLGWGPVTIGQAATAAAATGLFTATPAPSGGCAEWPAAGASPVESVVVSPTIGVAAIIARSGAVIHTPEGVTFGSTAEQVHAAYPAFDVADVETPNGPVIAVPGNSRAGYRLSFDDARKVSYLTLESVDQDCYA